MGHCPEPGHKKCQFAAHPAWGRFALIVMLLFTNLNRKGNAVGLKSSSNKTSRYAPLSLLFAPYWVSPAGDMLFPKDTPSEAPGWCLPGLWASLGIVPATDYQLGCHKLLLEKPYFFLVVLKNSTHPLMWLEKESFVLLSSAGFTDNSESQGYFSKAGIRGNTAPWNIHQMMKGTQWRSPALVLLGYFYISSWFLRPLLGRCPSHWQSSLSYYPSLDSFGHRTEELMLCLLCKIMLLLHRAFGVRFPHDVC